VTRVLSGRPRKLADSYRKMLENVAEGNHILDGFKGSSLGGAVRALQFWRDRDRFVVIDGDKLKLTDAGRKALETGEL
jgi:hypothetical protein